MVESARGPAVKLPNTGGGLPLVSIERPLGTHTIVNSIGNHDNHQHSYDENLRLQNLWDGIETHGGSSDDVARGANHDGSRAPSGSRHYR